jgi:transcriptional regulator with GAF, ATPase, and Fis domain
MRIRGAPLKAGDVISLGETTIIYEQMQSTKEVKDADTVAGPVDHSDRSLDERFRLLASLTNQINRDATSPTLFGDLVDAAILLTGGERGFLILCHRDGMQFAAARGIESSELDRPEFEVSWSIAVRVGTQGEPLLTMNALLDPRFENLASVEHLGLRSVICVPVRGATSVLGVIYVDHRIEHSVFREEDVNLLGMFADQAAIAITNRNLLESLKEKAQLVESLNQKLQEELKERDETITTLRYSLDSAGGDSYYDYRAIIGESKPIQELKALLRKVSQWIGAQDRRPGADYGAIDRCAHGRTAVV